MLVSVILPFYNNELTISDSIKSILNQTYKNFELILINNNSSDQSLNIISKFNDNRINLTSEKKQGIVFALNKGINVSKGKYIVRMDADDISYPERLQEQIDFLENNSDYDVVSCLVEYISKTIKSNGFSEYVSWINSLTSYKQIKLNQFIESPIIHPSVMIRKKVFSELGNYKNGNFPEDYELWLRLLYNNKKISKIDKYLLKWVDSEKRLTRTDNRYSYKSFFFIKSFYLNEWLKKNNPYYPEILVWGASINVRKKAEELTKKGIKIKNFVTLNKNQAEANKYIHYKEINKLKDSFIVSLVSQKGAHKEIKEFLNNINLKENKDYIFAS